MRALVVDDSRAMRKILARILNGMGIEVTDAENGQVALDRLKENGGIDLCLVDWNMPIMDGYEFICQVRADSSYENMKILMVTTESEIEQMVKALEAGADDYVMKPFTTEVISDKLNLLGIGENGS